jgi:hypothetical protein
MVKLSQDLIRQAMAQIGAKGGKRSLVTMSAEERSARAKIASLAAAKKRTAERLEKEGKKAKKSAAKGKSK